MERLSEAARGTMIATCCLATMLGPADATASGKAQDTPPSVSIASTEPVATVSIFDLQRGDKGYGVSVFEGTEKSRFDVEVIGVWRNSKPELSYLLTRLSGQGLEHTGVLGGMSGSPVYFDEKLVGAVAFSFSFGKDPIAGITPIGAMRDVSVAAGGLGRPAFGRPAAAVTRDDSTSAASPKSGLGRRPAWTDVLTAHGGSPEGTGLELLKRRLILPFAQASAEPGTPRSSAVWTAGGFHGTARTLLESGLGPALAPSVGLRSTGFGSGAPASGTDATIEELMQIVPSQLEGGDAVSVVLMGGDLVLAAHGTVTDRHGDSIVAFGHPIYSLGPIRLPMAESEVLTPIASVESSFKLSNAGRLIGIFDQDREPGAHGLLGVQPDLIPVTVTLRGLTDHRFDMFMADSYMFKPTLITLSTLSALNTVSFSNGYQGVDVKARFRLEGYDDLVVSQSFDGNQAATDAAIFVLTYAAFLELGESERASIVGVEIELDQALEPRLDTLEYVRADRRRVRPGDTVNLRLGVESYDGEHSIRPLPVKVPSDVPAGRYYLMVGDGTSMDAARLAIEPGEPRDLSASITKINDFSPRTSLQVMGLVAAPGLTVDGRPLPALPGSMRSILASGDAVQGTELRRLGEWKEPLDRPLEGIHRVDLVVER